MLLSGQVLACAIFEVFRPGRFEWTSVQSEAAAMHCVNLSMQIWWYHIQGVHKSSVFIWQWRRSQPFGLYLKALSVGVMIHRDVYLLFSSVN